MNQLARLLSRWKADPAIATNVVEWRSLPARPAQTVPLPAELHPALQAALRQRGIDALYTHQAAAWQSTQAGLHVAIVTGTASGKTLAYTLPVLHCLLNDPQARGLYIFPTKALAQDQSAFARSLCLDLASAIDIGQPAIYDGDTPAHARPAIRSQSRLLITNPDMLHIGILPHHTRWAHFLQNLRFVVIDEMHIYRGVFGSHITNVLRRLKRVASFYNSYPQFILTSATIANPGELASHLVEEPVQVIDQDGSARGPRHFLIYNPPMLDANLGLRRSAMQESVRLAEDLLAYQIQTILFARSRRSVEILLTYLRSRVSDPSLSDTNSLSEPLTGGNHTAPIRGYRSGYLSQERRSIEQGLRQGQVRAVVATNALELGIDIGGMGASILVGYPGTIAATLQQAGRAGRGADAALSILVATADPLDQFLAAHPEYLFGRSPEQALLNPDHLLILLDHLRCAAFELPFRPGETFGQLSIDQLKEYLQFLEEQGVLHRSGERYFWIADQYPAQNISLRSTATQPVNLYNLAGLEAPVFPPHHSALIGQVDQASAHWMVHPQAIYLHEGQTYLVESLALEQHIAWLRPLDSDYYTEAQREATVQLLAQTASAAVRGATIGYGEIQVTTQVTGYRQVRWYTHEQLDAGTVELPPTSLVTTGYWLALEDATVEHLRQQGLWTNDPNNYGPNWNTQRNLARTRDGYRCQMCGTPEQDHAHHVHHKIPFRTFTSYLQANQLENLITLCPPCHHRAEAAVRMRSGLAGLAYVLNHLAPFFLMCDIADLGVHSDPQSPIAEGKPVVALYDQVPAGIGFSQRLFEMHNELLRRAAELITACPCNDGCPSCVGPGGENGQGGKRETLAIIECCMSS